MKEKLYSIGQISAMMGISVQTLRFYEKINLFEPCYVNPKTGYRFYGYSQLHKIDRIKYFQMLGLSLKDINEIYQDGSIEKILDDLNRQKAKEVQAFEECKKKLEDLDWYMNYFSYLKKRKFLGVAYMKYFEKRFAIATDMVPGEPFNGANERLYSLKSQKYYNSFVYRRQYVHLLDDKLLRKGKTGNLKYGLYFRGEPEEKDENIMELPEGEYICFLARIYNEETWSPSIFEQFLEADRDYIVVADEYEDNLFTYDRSIFEVQIKEK